MTPAGFRAGRAGTTTCDPEEVSPHGVLRTYSHEIATRCQCRPARLPRHRSDRRGNPPLLVSAPHAEADRLGPAGDGPLAAHPAGHQPAHPLAIVRRAGSRQAPRPVAATYRRKVRSKNPTTRRSYSRGWSERPCVWDVSTFQICLGPALAGPGADRKVG